MPSNSPPVFDLRQVSYSYGATVTALEQITLQIHHGERVALLGANGSGKSTLLRLLAALRFADSGTISFFGQELTATRLETPEVFFDFRRRTGIVFQNSDVQLFNPSVFDEVAFGPLQLGLPRDEIRRRVEHTLSAMGIAGLSSRPPHRLSGGEKKRVALASVLVLDPDVLLLDEPTAGLDPNSAAQMIEWLSSWKDTHKTIVIATHDLDVLEEIADRCCVLSSGRLIADCEPVPLLHNVALLERAALIRLHPHTHDAQPLTPHPHVHRHEP